MEVDLDLGVMLQGPEVYLQNARGTKALFG